MPIQESSKPVLLIFPFGYLSHYLRCIVLAQCFRDRFTVLFASNKSYNGYVTESGFDTFPCAAIDPAETLSGIAQYDFSWMNEQSLTRAFNDQVAAIETLKPVAILGDAVPSLKMAADKTGVLFISLVNGYLSKHFAGQRALSVTHPAYPLVKKLPVKIAAMLTAKGEAMGFKAVHKPFRALRQKWGLAQKETYLDELEGDYTLLPDLLTVFPQKKLPASYRVIAPLFYEGTPPDSLLPPDVRKTIYVSMGSTGAWKGIALLNDPLFSKYRIIVTGDGENVLNASHITALPFGAAEAIFPQTDLVICHGGNGTIYQALAYGLPVLCLPVHFEQEWNTAAIVAAGLGADIAAVKNADDLDAAIRDWVSRKDSAITQEYKERIAFYRAALPGAIAALCEEILGRQTAL